LSVTLYAQQVLDQSNLMLDGVAAVDSMSAVG
jgi:hypothetical protein